MVLRNLLISLVLLAVSPVSAAILTPGNILVSDSESNLIREYTVGGNFVQSFSVTDDLGANGATELPRDLAVDTAGNIHVFNGTFNPSLSTINPGTGVQTDRTGPGFSIANSGVRGAIAAASQFVFVADQPVGALSDRGIIRFDTANNFAATRFATDFIPNDLTVGSNGLLYALGTESTSATSNPPLVNVYDPLSFARLNQIALPTATVDAGLIGVTPDIDGNLFAINFDDELVRLDNDGNVVATLASFTQANTTLTDLDIAADGTILITTLEGRVYLTDTSFSTPSTFIASSAAGTSRRMFATFTTPIVAVPEPSAWAILSIAGLAICLGRKRLATNPILESKAD